MMDFVPGDLAMALAKDGHGDSLISVLEKVQSWYRYLPREAMILVSQKLGVPLSQTYSVATFYHAFSLKPRGKYLIRVCLGTACHVRGAARILDEFQRILSVDAGMTTEDRLFTLETVNCLGACALGPIVVVDGQYHGNMNLAGVSKVIDAYAKRGAA